MAWLCSLALAGSQLVLSSDRPVVAYVNLTPHPLKGGSHEVVLDLEADAGVQRVALRNVLQELLWTGEVDVPDDHKVVIAYRNRRVTVTPPERIGHRKLSERGLYNVDGAWVKDRPHQDPRTVEAPPEDASTGSKTPTEDVFLGAVADAAGTEGAGGQHRSAEVIVRPEAGQGEGVLRLANRTTSWANLVVDTTDVPFRGEREKELTLPSGPHAIEVRNYSLELVWHGTVWVWPGETVELQFSEAAEPAAPDRPEAWQAKPLPAPAAP